MDKEELVDVEVSPSTDEVTTTTPDTTTTAPIVNESDAEKVTVEKPESTEPTEETKVTEEKVVDPSLEERNRNAQTVKMGKLEKERYELSQSLEKVKEERYQDLMESLNDPATLEKARTKLLSNQNTYEEFRQIHLKKTGEDLGDFASRSGQTDTSNQQGLKNNAYIDPNTIIQRVKTELKVEQEVEQAAREFWNAVPEMNPANAQGEDELELLRYKASIIDTTAEYYRKMNPSMSRQEAYIEAWNSLPDNRNRQVQIAQETGELKGMAKAFSNASSTTTGSSGSSTAPIKQTSYKLTQAERERYETLKKSDPQRAEKFAKYAHNAHIN